MIGRKEKSPEANDRAKLRAAIEATGQSLRKIAADAHISDGTVRAFLEGRTEKLNDSTAERLAQSLGRGSWADLMGRAPAAENRPRRLNALPIYAATAAPGAKALFQLNLAGPPAEHRSQVPPALIMSHRAFAFRLPFFDFAPRFQAGELIAADPDRLPGAGDDALVETAKGWLIGTVTLADADGVQLQVGRGSVNLAAGEILSLAYILRRGDFLGS